MGGRCGHPHRILRGVEAIGGGIAVELFTEPPHQVAEGTDRPTAYCAVARAPDAGTLPRRQASEQYLTSGQFFAQALRQLIGLLQWAQGFEGSAALLPLKLRRSPLIAASQRTGCS